MANKTRTGKIGHRLVALRKNETQRKDGMFIYSYYDNDHKRRTVSSKTLDGLREKEEELIRNKVNGIRSEKSTMTLNDTYEEWRKVKTVNPHTMQNYEWQYTTYVSGEFGKQRISRITQSDIIIFYKSLINDKNLSVSTVDGLHTVVQQIFIYAVKEHIIGENVCSGVMKDLIRHYGKHKEVETFTLAQEKRFLSFLKEYDSMYSSNWYPLFATMIFTGMRIGEMAGLQWSDVDVDRPDGSISVKHNLVYYKDPDSGQMVWRMNKPKTEAGIRSFQLPKKAREALTMQRDLKRKVEEPVAGYKDYVFVNRYGKTYQENSINRDLKRIIEKANEDARKRSEKGEDVEFLPSLSSHALRKCFITRCAEMGIDMKVCAKMVGHSDIRTTSEIYTMVSSEWKNSEVQKINECFSDFD